MAIRKDGFFVERIEEIRQFAASLIAEQPSSEARRAAATHLRGVAQLCGLLALKRDLDVELATIIGLLHDAYTYRSNWSALHGYSGAEMLRPLLRDLQLFSEEERLTICSAVFHHSDKELVHGPYEELLKDADTLQPYLYELAASDSLVRVRAVRLAKLSVELGFPFDIDEQRIAIRGIHGGKGSRLRLAEIAEELATKRIRGEKDDSDYVRIVRYWPELNAAEALKNGWCASFVYYCCLQAGFILPIRMPGGPSRLAGVAAWNAWAREQGFFLADEEGMQPQQGDIILFLNSIPAENKPPEQRDIPIDHIGIVIDCQGSHLRVAEGNINNQNQSGITERVLHENTAGYIRIPDGFVLDIGNFSYREGKAVDKPFARI